MKAEGWAAADPDSKESFLGGKSPFEILGVSVWERVKKQLLNDGKEVVEGSNRSELGRVGRA